MTEWEKDLSQEWDLGDWYRAFSCAYPGILNVSLIEADLKVVTCWSLAPTRLARYYLSHSCPSASEDAPIWALCYIYGGNALE